MDLDEKLIIKVQLNDEIRKMPIHNEEITYDELIIMMERVFKHKLNPNDEITIKYKDEDNDLITISDDSDLSFAIESSKVLKLVLTVQNVEEENADKNEKQFGSIDLKTIRKELQLIRDFTNKLLDKVVNFNNDTDANQNGSGRTSTTGVGDYHVVGGKEFDPLSVGHQTNLPAVERTSSSASITSNIRQDDSSLKDTPPQMRSAKPIPQPSQYPSHLTSPNINSSAGTGAFNMPPSAVGGVPNFPPQNMGGPGIMTGSNTGVSNVPPQYMGHMNLPPSSSPIGTGNLPPSSMPGQHLPPSNMTGQHLPPSSMSGQHLPPSNMTGQHLPPSSMPGQHLPPSNMTGQHMGGPNMPPNMAGFNPVSQSDGKVMPGYMGQGMPGAMARPTFYPPGTPPNQARPNLSNFNAPNQAGNTLGNGQQVRPSNNMPPMGSYYNPQTTMQQQQGGPIFNAQMQQQQQHPQGGPQSNQYGYQQNQ